MTKVSKIVSHNPPRHLDDFLALSVVMSRFPHRQVEFYPPQKLPQEYIFSPEVVLVDIGESYDKELNNFDHHQSVNLSCSLLLVLERFLPDYYEKFGEQETLQAIDLVDRFGPIEAFKRLGISADETAETCRRIFLFADIERYYYEVYLAFLRAIELAGDDFNLFLKLVYTKLDRVGVLSEAKAEYRKQEESFLNALRSTTMVVLENELKVAISKAPLCFDYSRAFEETGADVLVERNSMFPEHTSVIRNSKSVLWKDIDLSQIFKYYRPVFLHKNGFIAVTDVKVEDFDISILEKQYQKR